MAGNPAVDGNPKMLYLLCRNSGYDANNPDPNADNAPDLSPPDPADPNFYFENMQVMAQIYVADDNPSDPNAAHRHWMPCAGATAVSQEIDSQHFHYNWIKNDGTTKWSLENVAAAAQNLSVDYEGLNDKQRSNLDNNLWRISQAVAAEDVPHDHEVVTQYVINSLGEEYTRMRPKWMLCLGKCNSWTHQHWTDNGGGRTIIIAQRPYISGDDADPSTWEFDAKPENDEWDTAYRDQIAAFWRSRFGLELPVKDGAGDAGIYNDRRLIYWWNAINRFQWVDETRFG